MWSGPRNISTAMMRAFGNRADTVAVDEPLYAHYLATTGIDHPGRDEILAAQDRDWRTVTAWLTGPIPEGRSVWYQKHMTHHMIPEVGLDWLGGVTSAFLIREPRRSSLPTPRCAASRRSRTSASPSRSTCSGAAATPSGRPRRSSTPETYAATLAGC